MLNVQGYAALKAKSALVPFKFTRREPQEHDVLIDIHYCGICHSDIHQVRAEWGDAYFPMVPGHEIVGEVVKIGSSVTKYKVGDKVGVGCFVDSCRNCASCHEGLESYCERGMILTYNCREKDGETLSQGGYSTKIVVNEDYVLRIPANLPLNATAPLLCAGITLYSPLRHWQAGPNKKVAVIGLGGIGHMGVKLAAAMGADVTVLSHSASKKTDSLRFGAQHFYVTKDQETFTKLARSFDLILCTASANINWNDYISLLKRDGTMVLLGLPENPTPVSAGVLIGARRSLAGSLIGGIKETQEMLDFCGQHNISADIELIPINKVNEAYERVIKSDVRYRFVIDIKTLSSV
ncbi:MAG: hydroxyacid dehydrogenase [Legionellales bacterium RIFCSPHIGHO2_12_FULL_37_14]|nr:MAG: hydroxyacid dehydrogenase [Legionellales bacterium RIFCSPHIGHO2_12_FULL_37_14]